MIYDIEAINRLEIHPGTSTSVGLVIPDFSQEFFILASTFVSWDWNSVKEVFRAFEAKRGYEINGTGFTYPSAKCSVREVVKLRHATSAKHRKTHKN